MVVTSFKSRFSARVRILSALFFPLCGVAQNAFAPRAFAQETPPIFPSVSTQKPDAGTAAPPAEKPNAPSIQLQNPPQPKPVEKPAVSEKTAVSEKPATPSIAVVKPSTPPQFSTNFLTPQTDAPLFWAEGITRAGDLDEYSQTGLTAIVVRLSWRAESSEGDALTADFALPKAFAMAAARRGLKIIYAFPARPAGEFSLRVSGDSQAYSYLWESYVAAAMEALKDTPNLAGWMLPDDPRSLAYESEIGFAKWIAANYADVRVLNAQWLTNFPSLETVTLGAAKQVAESWRKRRDSIKPADRAQAPDTTWPFHPAALMLAQYRREAYRALVTNWAQAIKKLDATRPLFSGQLPDYAQMLALPPQVDVSVAAAFPGAVENDFATHNPQAVDIARRGNRFRAVSMLTTETTSTQGGGSNALPPESLAMLLPTWCRAALLHGASGLAFSSWNGLRDNAAPRDALQATLRALQISGWRDLWKTTPLATSAVVLTPLADGYTQNNAAFAAPRGLYGFGENLLEGEPSNLVYKLRQGTNFGPIDFLAPEDVEESVSTGNSKAKNEAPEYTLDETPISKIAKPSGNSKIERAPLSRYSALLMPQALSLSPSLLGALEKYAENGGAVVTDLGMGALQNGGRVLGMPAAIAKAFGIAAPRAIAEMSFDLRAGETSPLLLMWSRAIEEAPRGGFLTGGENRGNAFSGAVALGGALPAGTTQIGFAPAPRNDSLGDLGVSLSLKTRGEGALLYAPFLLWRDWRPEHIGFTALHGDLMVKRAALMHLNAPSIVPLVGPPGREVPATTEVINYADALVLLNHWPPSTQQNLSTQMTPRVSMQVSQRGDERNRGRIQTRPPVKMPSGALPPKTKLPPPTPDKKAAGKPSPEAENATTPPPVATATPVPAPPGLQQAIVQTPAPDGFLWNDLLCAFPPLSTQAGRPFSLTRPLPISAALGTALPTMVTLHAKVEAGGALLSKMLPLQVKNMDGGSIAARVTRFEERKLSLTLWANVQQISPESSGEFRVVAGGGAGMQITVYDSPTGYRVIPNSRHRVTASEVGAPLGADGKRATATDTVTADVLGRLQINAGGIAPQIEVEPIA